MGDVSCYLKLSETSEEAQGFLRRAETKDQAFWGKAEGIPIFPDRPEAVLGSQPVRCIRWRDATSTAFAS